MKSWRKIGAAVMAVVVMAGAASCGTNDAPVSDQEEKSYRIGICQLTEHDALDEASKGFQEALTERLGDRVSFDLQLADGSREGCDAIVEKFTQEPVDLIMANATDALKAAADATDSIPIVAASITDYATALDMDTWTGSSGTNVTGTSDLASIEAQEDMMQELFPDLQKVGILYCASEVNSKFQAEKMETALAGDGLDYQEYTAEASKKSIREAAELAAEECDVIYIPTDNALASKVSVLKDVFLDAGIPMIASEEGLCEAGVATLSIDYYDIGYMAGEMAYEILEEGKDPASMGVRYAESVTKKYNEENCKALGIEVPEGYQAI